MFMFVFPRKAILIAAYSNDLMTCWRRINNLAIGKTFVIASGPQVTHIKLADMG